jgi:hypothetical protein
MKKGPIQLKTIQKKTPVAPPAYRPMPVPKVLQRKTAVAGPGVNKTVPVPHVLQRKAISPPVPVKPNPSPLVQRKQPARPGISQRGILQPKVIQRAQWSMGQSDAEMSDQQWRKSGMATYCSIMVDDGDDDGLVELGLGKSLKTKTYGAEHAEDVAMRTLLAEYGADGLAGLNVILSVSKSPCSSGFKTSNKAEGCAEALVQFAADYKCKISIICRGLYKGLEASQLAVNWMRLKGVDVSVDVRLGAEKRFGEG